MGGELMTTNTLIGSHPQPFMYYVWLVTGTFRTMLDVAMLAAGSALVGLAVAVFGDTFGLFGIGLVLSTSAALGAALVVGILGAFALGIASEGRYGVADSVREFPIGEVAVGRVLGSVLVGLLLTTITSRTVELVADLSLPIQAAHGLIEAAGTAALIVVPLVGVPIATGARVGLVRLGFTDSLDLPILYAIWAIAVLLIFDMPV